MSGNSDVTCLATGVSFYGNMTKEEALQMAQNLLKENYELQDIIQKGNATMGKMEKVLLEVHTKYEADQSEVKQQFEQAKSVILNLRCQVQALEKKQSADQNSAHSEATSEQREAASNDSGQYRVNSSSRMECEIHKSDIERMKVLLEQTEKKAMETKAELEEQLKEYIDMCSQREDQMSMLIQQNKTLVEEKKHLRDRTQQLVKINEELQRQLAELKQRLTAENQHVKEASSVEKEGIATTSGGLQQDVTTAEISDQLASTTLGEEQRANGISVTVDSVYKKQLEEEKQRGVQLRTHIEELSAALEKVKESEKAHVQNEEKLLKQCDVLRRELHHSEGHVSENTETLKAQVVCLVNEIKESNQKRDELHDMAEHYRQRCKELENKCATLEDDLESLRATDDHLIEALRSTVAHMETSLAEQKEKKDMQSYLLEEYRAQLEDARSQAASQLSSGNILVSLQEKREQEEKLGSLTAQLISKEDLLVEKQEENQKLKQEIIKLKRESQEIAFLKYQAELYRRDFQAEQRERKQDRKRLNELKEECEQLRLFNQELQDQLRQLTLAATHASLPSELNTPSHNMRGEPYPGGGWDECDKTNTKETSSADDTERCKVQSRIPSEHMEESSDAATTSEITQYICPTCGLEIVDFDSLAIHASECVPDST